MTRVAALLLLLAVAAGCAPARQRIAGEEAAAAEAFFAKAAAVGFPVRAAFAGYAEFSGTSVPVVAGVNSRTPSQEILGLYDPIGQPVLYVENDGTVLRVRRGDAAGELVPAGISTIAAGPISLGRVLVGAPGYPIGQMEASRGKDGEWVLSDRRQSLYSDPARRVLARAEYRIGGKRFLVSYPDRAGAGAPPDAVVIEGPRSKMVLRRDAE